MRGLLSTSQVGVLGARDAVHREALGVPSIRHDVWFADARTLAADPAGQVALAARHLSASTSAWWLHVDVDVLATSVFGSYGAPGEADLDGGLTWPQLTEAVGAAVGQPGCRGMSLGVYNPDLDDTGRDARAIVTMVAEVVDLVAGLTR